jgi:hypothetical protein
MGRLELGCLLHCCFSMVRLDTNLLFCSRGRRSGSGAGLLLGLRLQKRSSGVLHKVRGTAGMLQQRVAW